MREEFLELLRTDRAFRDEVRRHLLTEELLALPVAFERLMALVQESVAMLARLAEVVQHLAEAQVRTEERVGRLEERMGRVEERVGRLEEAMARMVEAQARAEERMARMEEAMVQLTEAQRRTEERIGRLEAVVEQLAEAQRRAEERMARMEEAMAQLTEAQARTEARAEELARAYIRMQEVMQSLAQQVGQLSQQVGRLSDVVGFALEDLAREVTPAYLAQHYGIRVEGLERRFFMIEDQEIEIDLYGEGWRDGEQIVVLGEVRSRIYGRDVEAVVRRASELRPQVIGTPIVVLFGFVIHPSAKEVAQRLGAIVISSSGR